MPKKVRHRRYALQARKNPDERNHTKKRRRAGYSGDGEKAPKVISDSLFALTLKPVPAVVVVTEKMRGSLAGRSLDTEEDFERMYDDLFASMRNALRLVTGEETFDPLRSGLNMATALGYVVDLFRRNVLPQGFDMNIDRDHEGEYFFTIFSVLPVGEQWMMFELAPVVHYLRDTNPKLHDLYIILMKSLTERKDILTWWNGGMGYAQYALEEQVHEIDEDDHGSDAVDRMLDAWIDYLHGEAYEYQLRIKAAPSWPGKKILKRLRRFNQKDPVVKWMKQCCEFIDAPGSMHDFIYPEVQDNLEGVEWEQTAVLGWDWNDQYSELEGESLDALATGCGVMPPIFGCYFKKDTRRFDRSDFEQRLRFPYELQQLFEKHRWMIEWIKSKTKRSE